MESNTSEQQDSQLLAAQERLVRRRQERKAAIESTRIEPTLCASGDISQVSDKSTNAISTRLLDYEDYEDYEENEENEENEESPSGDAVTPSAAARDEIQNANAKDWGIHESQDAGISERLLTASVESELSARGGCETTEQLFSAGRYNEISVAEFLQLAWAASAGNSWLETGVSETWEFCRYLLAHPKFSSLRGGALAKALRRLMDIDGELITAILLEIERVQYAKGAGPLEWAVAMACQPQYQLSDPEELGLEGYNRFLSIAGWLQIARNPKSIVLPVAKLAGELGVTARTVSYWRQLAERQGLLSEVEHYVAHRKATQFRFAIERFGILRERGNL